MEYKMDSGWLLEPIGGDTGQAYKGTRNHEKIFIKRNSSPFLAALSAEGITPRLIWTKRAGNGDTITAQEWLSGRSLTKEEMASEEVIDLLKQIHQSPTLLHMLQRIQGEEYGPERFLEDYHFQLQTGLQQHQFLNQVVHYLTINMDMIKENGKTVCHGDLNRRNFLLSDENRLYLVDWEMVRLADPISDLTTILIHYVPVSKWGEWLDQYGVQLSTNIYQRIEWYSLMNGLSFIKKAHFEGRYYEMNEVILLIKRIFEHRLGRKE